MPKGKRKKKTGGNPKMQRKLPAGIKIKTGPTKTDISRKRSPGSSTKAARRRKKK